MPTSIPLGAPIWVDTVAEDFDSEVEFYTRLFDWKALIGGEEIGGYTEFRLGDTADDGRAVGGIMPKQPDMPDAPPAWSVAFHVGNCEETTTRAEKLGATVTMPPTPIGDDMVYSMLDDPNGASFGLFEPRMDDMGFKAYGERHAVTWLEYGFDGVPAAAMQFYAELLGWEVKVPIWNNPDDPRPYAALSPANGGAEFGGCHAAVGPEMELPAQWVAMFLVDSADETAAKAEELGGSIVGPPMDTPNLRIAGIASPGGAAFGIMSELT